MRIFSKPHTIDKPGLALNAHGSSRQKDGQWSSMQWEKLQPGLTRMFTGTALDRIADIAVFGVADGGRGT